MEDNLSLGIKNLGYFTIFKVSSKLSYYWMSEYKRAGISFSENKMPLVSKPSIVSLLSMNILLQIYLNIERKKQKICVSLG